MASPRLMWAGVTRLGLPSTTSKPTFISGIDFSALTRAKPMMWVNDTLPPRARARWLLITMRLSHSSLTGTDRTLVAVGTVRLASMLATVRAGAPLRTVYFGSSSAADSCFWSVSLGVDLLVPAALLFVSGDVALSLSSVFVEVLWLLVPADLAGFSGSAFFGCFASGLLWGLL